MQTTKFYLPSQDRRRGKVGLLQKSQLATWFPLSKCAFHQFSNMSNYLPDITLPLFHDWIPLLVKYQKMFYLLKSDTWLDSYHTCLIFFNCNFLPVTIMQFETVASSLCDFKENESQSCKISIKNHKNFLTTSTTYQFPELLPFLHLVNYLFEVTTTP